MFFRCRCVGIDKNARLYRDTTSQQQPAKLYGNLEMLQLLILSPE